MTNYHEYNKHSISIAYEHLTNALLQGIIYIQSFIIYKSTTYLLGKTSPITYFTHKLSLYSLKNLITEASTSVGHLPILNNIGYYIFKDTIIPNQNSHIFTKEMYNKKLEFVNKFIPLTLWWIIEVATQKKILGSIYTQLDILNSGLKVMAYSYASENWQETGIISNERPLDLYLIALNFESQIIIALLIPAIGLKLISTKIKLRSLTEYIDQNFELVIGDFYFELTTLAGSKIKDNSFWVLDVIYNIVNDIQEYQKYFYEIHTETDLSELAKDITNPEFLNNAIKLIALPHNNASTCSIDEI